MSNLTFPDFTLEASPSLTDFVVGYRTNIAGGERRTTLQSVSDLLGTGYFGSLTANRLLLGQANGTLASSDLTYSTPTLSVPASFAIAGAGAVNVTTASNGNFVVSPNGTGLTLTSAPILGTDDATVTTYQGSAISGGGNVAIQRAAGIPAYNILGVANNGRLNFEYAAGTFASKTGAPSGTTMSEIRTRSWDGTSAYPTSANISVIANGNQTTSNGGAIFRVSVVPSNLTALSSAWDVNSSVSGRTAWNTFFNATRTKGSWATTGSDFEFRNSGTTTDSTGAGTSAVQVGISSSQTTWAATNARTYTDAFSWWFGGPPIASTNVTITRNHTVGILDSTSAASSITGGLVIAAAFGTAATSVGIGGGNINAGGSITGLSFTSGTPNGGTAGAWKLGIRVAATVILDTSQYIQVDIGGTLYKLALAV